MAHTAVPRHQVYHGLENLEQGRLSFVSDDGKKSLWQMAKLLRSSEKEEWFTGVPPEGKEKTL